MQEDAKREIDFERLNLLGKAVFVTGTTFRVVGEVVNSVMDTLSGVVREAEKAFRAGLDGNVDDATILEEKPDQ